MKESEIREMAEGRYTEIREAHAEALGMLRRVAKKVDSPEAAIDLAELILTFSKSLLSSDITFKSETCGLGGGGGG